MSSTLKTHVRSRLNRRIHLINLQYVVNLRFAAAVNPKVRRDERIECDTTRGWSKFQIADDCLVSIVWQSKKCGRCVQLSGLFG